MQTCHFDVAVLQDASEDDEQDTPDISFGRLLPQLLAQLETLPADARCATMPIGKHSVGKLLPGSACELCIPSVQAMLIVTHHQHWYKMCRVLVAAAGGLDGEAAVLAAARLAVLQGITAYQALIHVSHRRLALQLKVHIWRYHAPAMPTVARHRVCTSCNACNLHVLWHACYCLKLSPYKSLALRSAMCPFLQPGLPRTRRPKTQEQQRVGN
jgi:hypothetical protein